MWLSKDLVGFFQISHEVVSDLKSENAELKATNAALIAENAMLRTHFDWLKTKVNALELERAGLIEKAYSIKLPVPEIARTSTPVDPNALFGFDDIGDMLAKIQGQPVYGDNAD